MFSKWNTSFFPQLPNAFWSWILPFDIEMISRPLILHKNTLPILTKKKRKTEEQIMKKICSLRLLPAKAWYKKTIPQNVHAINHININVSNLKCKVLNHVSKTNFSTNKCVIENFNSLLFICRRMDNDKFENTSL